MLSVDGHADATPENRIRIGGNKFRQEDHCLPINIYITESKRETVQWFCAKQNVTWK